MKKKGGGARADPSPEKTQKRHVEKKLQPDIQRVITTQFNQNNLIQIFFELSTYILITILGGKVE